MRCTYPMLQRKTRLERAMRGAHGPDFRWALTSKPGFPDVFDMVWPPGRSGKYPPPCNLERKIGSCGMRPANFRPTPWWGFWPGFCLGRWGLNYSQFCLAPALLTASAGGFSALSDSDQISATHHPINVHPNRRLVATMEPVFRWPRLLATMVGAK